MGNVAAGERVHILDEHPFFRQILKHDGEGAARVRTGEAYDVAHADSEVGGFEGALGRLRVRHYAAQYAEIGVVGYAHRREVYARAAQHCGNLGELARLVLKEH